MKTSEHIDHLLQDLLDGELDAETASRAERHLEHCARCRDERDALSALVAGVRALPRTVDPPRDLWGDIEARLREAPTEAGDIEARLREAPTEARDARYAGAESDGPADPRPVAADWSGRRGGTDSKEARTLVGSPAQRSPRSRPVGVPVQRSQRRRRFRLGIAAVLAAASCAVLWLLLRGGGPGWGVETLDGRPLIARQLVGEQGVLRPGQWLETDETSRARLVVGSIGEVEVEPSTRIQLRRSKLNDHRIALAEGRIDARIWAPPRLFFVETPSATAIDLGCAYTLEVDSTGKSVLHVTSGYVELEREGKSSVVPAGAMCYASPDVGPGTVFAEDAAPALRSALERYDFGDAREEDLAIVLSEARPKDAMTLWQLAEQSDHARRAKIYDRLTEIVHPPAGVTREGILAGDDEMFEMWRLHLGLEAMSWWGYLREKMSFPD